MTDETKIQSLLGRLDAIAVHDWRHSFLAHTSDTAYEARNVIVGLLAMLSLPPRDQ